MNSNLNANVTADLSVKSPVLPQVKQDTPSEVSNLPVQALSQNDITNADAIKAKQQAEAEAIAEKSPDPSAEEVGKAVEDISQYFQSIERDLLFQVDEESGRTIITVVDAETDEIVRQIPPKELLNIVKRLGDIKGVLFKAQA